MYVSFRVWDEWKCTQNKSRLLFLTVVRLVAVAVAWVALMEVRSALVGAG
jgi:hypothetical protein